MIHIHNGDVVAALARRSDIPGEHIAYRETLVTGPVVPGPEWIETRAHAILISPVWGIDLPQLAAWVAESGLNVRMQLQLHKYIWGPDVHGV